MIKILLTGLGLCAVAAPAFAQSDKSGFSLLNPTPRELRRPLSADRPDATESPYTVDAGAVQIELSFVEYTTNDDRSARSHDWSVAPVNAKIGVTNSIDLQLLLDPWVLSDRPLDSASGLGNSGVRVKLNLVGNDEGAFAAALLPYIVFPTGDHDVVSDQLSAGLVVPVALDPGGGWSLGAQLELATVGDGAGRDTLLAHTVVIGRDIGDRLGVYGEYIGESIIDGDERYSPSLSGGLTWSLRPDVQFDFGAVVGLDDDHTDDLTLFSGVTMRF